MAQFASHLVGERALITGACSGLGLALAKELADRGWQVAMLDIKVDETAVHEVREIATRAGGSVLAIAMDVCDLDAWGEVRQTILDAWGGLDLLINNAGIADAGTIFSINEERWARMLDINIMGVVRGTAAFAPMMKDQHAGHIVNIASMAGLFALPSMISYNVSKAGVVALSETLVAELDPHGIAVTCVCPHFFKTNIGANMTHATPATKSFLEKQLSKAKVTSEDVVAKILSAVDRRQYMCLTHPGSGREWLMKRLMPGRVINQMKKFAAKIAAKGGA